MADSHEVQLARLRQSMAAFESQRDEIGDDAIVPVLNALKDQIAALEASQFTKSGDTEERRIVTILFTDIVGSTSIAERMDPEDWRSTISAVHEMAGKIVDRNDGRVLQYLGDGLLAVFGTEFSSERDPERGIKTALQIIAELPTLNLEPPLQMRAGVHTGLVVMGELGSYAKREFTASGDAMNLAARLQSSAPANGVAISHDTYRYVRGLFDMTPQAPFKVRGRQEPLRTYLVHQAKTHPFRMVTRGVGGVKVPTIGREAENSTLTQACKEAVQTKRKVWNQIRGEPGVGKTRLLQDVAESLELPPDAFEWLKTQAIEGDARRPYTLVRRMWFERFQIAEDSPVEEAEAKWVRGIESLLGAGTDEEAHVLGLLVGLPFEGSPFLRTLRHDPSQMKGRAFVISRELLTKLRQKDPVVLLIEDLQWADQASWEYLTHVVMHEGAEDDEDQALIVLATTRPEWKPPAELLSHSEFHLMDLPALSESDCRTLVQELLQRTEEIPDEAVQVIVERSQGIPYFAEEMVNWLIDKGVIDIHAEPWIFTPSLFSEALLPDTLQHLLTTRLGSLTDSQRRALESASIYGRNFWEDGLRYLGVEPGDELLEAVEQRGFIEAMPTSTFVDDREWRFHHDLMRDATYEMILKRNRPGMHKKAATWLESRVEQAGRLPEFAGVLGDHFERAGELSEAADWYLRAGERAWSQGAVIESREFYDRTIELFPATDRERLWSVLLNRDKVLALLGEVENRRVDVDRLLALAGDFNNPGRFAEAYYRRGVFLDSLGDFREAVKAYETAIDFAESAGDITVEMLAAAISVYSYVRLGELSAAEQFADRALDGVDKIQEDSARAKILANVGTYFNAIGDLSRAASLGEQAVGISERLGDRWGEALSLSNLGYIYMQLGMFTRAQTFLHRALKLDEGLGALRPVVYTLLNLGLVAYRAGDQVGAKAFLARAQSEMEPLGDTFAIAISHMYLGFCIENAKDFSAAIDEYSTALDIYEDTGLEGNAIDAQAGLARCKQALEFDQEALDHTRVVWTYLQEHGSRGLEFPILAYLTCARIFEAVGEDEQSTIAIEEGWNELMSRADRISDASWRGSFIETVPEHRDLSEMWDRKAGLPASRQREDEDGGQ